MRLLFLVTVVLLSLWGRDKRTGRKTKILVGETAYLILTASQAGMVSSITPCWTISTLSFLLRDDSSRVAFFTQWNSLNQKSKMLNWKEEQDCIFLATRTGCVLLSIHRAPCTYFCMTVKEILRRSPWLAGTRAGAGLVPFAFEGSGCDAGNKKVTTTVPVHSHKWCLIKNNNNNRMPIFVCTCIIFVGWAERYCWLKVLEMKASS